MTHTHFLIIGAVAGLVGGYMFADKLVGVPPFTQAYNFGAGW